MPNLYATPAEIKAEAPDMIQAATTKYDRQLMRLANDVSRQIDRITGKKFYPTVEARIFSPERDDEELRIPDLVSLTEAAYSADGLTYTAISSSYIVGEVEENRNSKQSYTHLRLLYTSPVGTWPGIEDGVKITGVWAYTDNRDDCWEEAGALSSSVSTGATSLKIADSTLIDKWGYGYAYQAGRLCKIDSEFFEITAVTASTGATDTLTVVGARNGSTAASHSSGATIYIWKPYENVKSACIIEAVKRLNRGLQGYENARATPDMGQPIYERKLDVQTLKLLEPVMEF